MAPENDKGRGQAANVGTAQESEQRGNHTTLRPRKWQRVLAFLLTGASANRFDAERELHDHVLPSTVSDLQRRGVNVLREDETVPGYQGAPTHCCRYRLAPESYDRARELLGLPAPAPREQIALLPAAEGAR